MRTFALEGKLKGAVLGVAALLIALVELFSHPGEAFAQQDVGMQISVEGAAVSCTANRCEVPVDGSFTVVVQTAGIPAEGYVSVGTHLFYGELTYQAVPREEEIVWPDSTVPLRDLEEPTGTEGLIAHGALTSLTPPFTVSTFEGDLVQLQMSCPADGTYGIVLLGLDPDADPLGSNYTLEDTSSVPLRASATIPLDAVGSTVVQDVPVADSVEIVCGTGEGGPGPPPINGAQNGPDGQATPGDQDGTPDADGTQEPTAAETPPAGGAAEQTATAEAEATATAIAAEDDVVDGDDDDDDGVPVWVWIVIVVAVVAALGGGYLGWRYWQARQGGGGPPSGPTTSSPPSTPPGTDDGGGPDGP